MYLEFTDISNPIPFCLDVILREAREEDRLVKQIIYTMLSAYTYNPCNLAINSPSGEGKTYILQKVGEKFPKEDTMFLAGMTDKALFHRQGILVIKNEIGEYEPIDRKIAEIDSEIQDKENELVNTIDKNLKQGLRSVIEGLKNKKSDLLKEAKKLIDLSHKILVFLDTPRAELFNALMPLLSHDKYEVEYEFVDTHNGIKTKTNVLRGWPAVIFAQAIDYSHYQRYPEIQRRFIITNPKMSAEKYKQAVDLIGDKFGLPDFAYQEKIISDEQKEKVREIIREIKQKILDVCSGIEPGINNVIIPFNEILTKLLLPKDKAFDMTSANRFFGFLALLPLISIDKRPRLILRKKGDPVIQTIPFALFDDLKVAMFLMEYSNGVRPYVLEWYYDVFLEAYNTKTAADSKENSKGEMITENRIAITTEQLVEKTKNVYKQGYTTKKILETYINPLINQGYIDKANSELDKRAHIYYPVIITAKNRKLFEIDQSNNFSQQNRIIITNPIFYPSKQYIISKIDAILGYSAGKDFPVAKIKSHEGNELTVNELVDTYYGDADKYFEFSNLLNNKPALPLLTVLPALPLLLSSSRNTGEDVSLSSSKMQSRTKEENYFFKGSISEEYLKNSKITNESQKNSSAYTKSAQSKPIISNKLFEGSEKNNFVYSCYYCDGLQTDVKYDYERHVILKHPDKPAYPCKIDLIKLRIQAKGKSWEI
jgi:hypothetical protein